MRPFVQILFCLFTALLLASLAAAQQDVITTAIGGGPNDIPAIDADIYQPIALTFDGNGNYYIAAYYANRVFKVDGSGTITVVAGIGIAGFGGDGVAGGASQAMLNGPSGVAVDGAGNIYISDYNNFVIRKVDSTNTITTIAGQAGSCGYNGDGKPATNFSLCHPLGVALDSLGNLFIGDGGNCRVRKLVLATKTIATSAGTGTCGYTGDNGSAVSAQLNTPYGVAVDSANNVFIADTSNYVIRKVTKANGKITTVGGSHVYGFGGDGSSALAALISNVYDLTVDSAGSVVTLADYNNNRIRQFTVGGNMNTIAGSGAGGFCGDGGPATSACLSGPEGLGFDGSGHLFIADASNYRVREVIGGNINTVAGNGSNTQPTTTNHVPPSGVVFNYPIGVFGDTSSNIFIADTQNSRVRQLVHSTNLVDLFAGTGTAGYNGDNQPAVNAQLYNPYGTVKDSAGNLYIADTYNHAIRKVDTAGKITTFAGSPQHCGYTGDGGPATTAWMCYPAGLAIDSSNAIYVADSGNHVVRKIASGTINTVAGINRAGYSGDGGPATSAQLYNPYGVAVDGTGNVYIADTNNCRVRMVNAFTQIINTVAGNAACTFNGDGLATQSSLNGPFGVDADANGNVFIADTNNHRVRWLDTAGYITTFGGTGTFGFFGDNGPATSAYLGYPTGIWQDPSGNYLIADQYNFRIRAITAFSGLSRSASNLSFGLQTSGSTSQPQTVVISAVGSISIANIAVTGDFAEVDNCPASMTNGQTCLMYVYFMPTGSGTRTGTVTINDNGLFSQVQTINLTGLGTAITIGGAPINFGNQLVKTTSAPKNVTVTNNGNNSITMGAITLNETTDFAISSNNCPASGQPLAAHASCTVGLTFGPKSTGAKKGALIISDSDPSSPQLAGVSGVGTSTVVLSPATVVFKTQAIGTTSPSTKVTLTNNTGKALVLGSTAVTITGDFLNATGTTCTNSLSIPANGSCFINVGFKPKGSGLRTGVLSVADNDPTSPQTVALSGTGTAVKFTPAVVNFGSVTVGSQVSAPVTLTNVGTTTLVITSGTVTGPNSADFSSGAGIPPCSGVLAPAATCNFNMFFKPSKKGAEKANFNLYDNSPGSPQQLPLSGTGQ